MSNPRVLLIDDDAVTRVVVMMLLQQLGCTVDAHESGQSALKQLDAGRDVSLILMDIQMSGLNGIETMNMIRERFPSIGVPIVAMTGADLPGDKERLLDAGFDDYMAKPVRPEALFRVLKLT
ncbi:MAG: response regulator [Myxococcales bacterium]|nr:response regulator [Myxococcales bacterium]